MKIFENVFFFWIYVGIKANYETSGVDSAVKLGDCKASLNKTHHVGLYITFSIFC